MSAINFSVQALRQPKSLAWWQWGHVLGLWLAVATAVALALGVELPPLALAVILHVVGDFPLQDGWIAAGKRAGDRRALFAHAVIAGGLAGLPFGPLAAVVLIAAHFAVDLAGKFGLPDPQGPIVDQVAHIALIAALALARGAT